MYFLDRQLCIPEVSLTFSNELLYGFPITWKRNKFAKVSTLRHHYKTVKLVRNSRRRKGRIKLL